jgi:hypothetical protein
MLHDDLVGDTLKRDFDRSVAFNRSVRKLKEGSDGRESGTLGL